MSDQCNIRVLCRFRPINQRELNEGGTGVKIEFPNDKTVNIIEESNKQPQIFTFDKVFESNTKQVIQYKNEIGDFI